MPSAPSTISLLGWNSTASSEYSFISESLLPALKFWRHSSLISVMLVTGFANADADNKPDNDILINVLDFFMVKAPI